MLKGGAEIEGVDRLDDFAQFTGAPLAVGCKIPQRDSLPILVQCPAQRKAGRLCGVSIDTSGGEDFPNFVPLGIGQRGDIGVIGGSHR
jgi:hypothetical protein